jgi:hypothetical protein
MGRLLVLSEKHVSSLLLSLNKEHVKRIATGLSGALRDLSVGDASCGGAAEYHTMRTRRTRPSGDTNVFMPAMSSTAFASKLLGVPSATPAASSEKSSSATLLRTAPRGARKSLSGVIVYPF